MPSPQALLIVGGRDLVFEISTGAARRFEESLAELGYEVVQVNASDHLTPYLEAADLVVPLLFDPMGAGSILALVESTGKPFVGPPFGTYALASDKAIARTVLGRHGIAVPNGFVATAHGSLHLDTWPSVVAAADRLGYPLVVKPAVGSFADGLSVIDGEQELSAAIADAMRFCDRVLVEEYVAGREFIAILVGPLLRALPLVEVSSGSRAFDFRARARPLTTSLHCPSDLTSAEIGIITDVARAGAQALGARDFVRVELILSGSGPVILEVAPTPALYAGGSVDLAVRSERSGNTALVSEILASADARRGTPSVGARRRLKPMD